MSKNLIRKYIWLVDVLNRYKRLTRSQIEELWMKDDEMGGSPFSQRTFFNYRRAIEDIFHIDILCDEAGQYYIAHDESLSARTLSNWLLDSYAINDALAVSNDLGNLVEVEDVPSARKWLPQIIDSIRTSRKLRFSYAGFTKSAVDVGILFSPYFLKRFKQRWYMVGMKERTRQLRTYALDRIRMLEITDTDFKRPANLDMSEIFGNIIGVTASKGEIRNVRIKTTPMQAKYFRALPFHPSQQEEVADDFSIFTFRLRVNYELVHELMSFGASVQVIDPPELRNMVRMAFEEALALYD